MYTVRITGDQLRSARRLLDWSVQGLAARSSVNWLTIRKYESAGSYLPPASVAAMNRLVSSLEAAGIEFRGDGSVERVGRPTSTVRTLVEREREGAVP
jgi:ribosome-binding protein aMBF1 (putative translation factor)